MINSKVNKYINQICTYVKFKKSHKEIHTELINHIEEKTEALIDAGITEEAAIEKTILEMGSAEIIGKELNKVHKAAPEWSILIITLLFSFIGMLIAYLVIKNNLIFYSPTFRNSVLFNIIGFILIIFFYFLDYKKLERHSNKIYIVTTIILFIQLLLAHRTQINGNMAAVYFGVYSTFGALTLDFSELSLFLYAISLSSQIKNFDQKNLGNYLILTVILFIPFILYKQGNLSMSLIIYFILFIALIIKSKLNKFFKFFIYIFLMLLSLFSLLLKPYILRRLLVYINFSSDSKDMSYIYSTVHKLLFSTGLIGHGLSVSHKSFPSPQSELVLPYIIYTFGWIAGITLITLVFVFLLRIFRTANSVRDVYGKLVIQSFLCIFTVEFVWNILMVFGLLPISGVIFPFISYSGSKLLVHMSAIGLIMSIYRHKSLSYAISAT